MKKTGLVIAHQGIKILVKDQSGDIQSHTIKRNSDFVVGDYVSTVETHAKLLPRKNLLQRQTPYGRQSVAANLDGVGIVIAQNPPFSRLFLDQVILCARSQNIAPFIVLNKIDQSTSEDLNDYLNETFASQGIPIFKVSALKEMGIQNLKTHIGNIGRCIFVGVSGVGKSSLLNRISKDANQKTGTTVDKDRHGRHTTSQSILFEIDKGELIDSPGVRDFAPPLLKPNEIANLFVGFSDFLTQACRFRNCYHEVEPGCVIKDAVSAGKILNQRYELYLELLNSSKEEPRDK